MRCHRVTFLSPVELVLPLFSSCFFLAIPRSDISFKFLLDRCRGRPFVQVPFLPPSPSPLRLVSPGAHIQESLFLWCLNFFSIPRRYLGLSFVPQQASGTFLSFPTPPCIPYRRWGSPGGTASPLYPAFGRAAWVDLLPFPSNFPERDGAH